MSTQLEIRVNILSKHRLVLWATIIVIVMSLLLAAACSKSTSAAKLAGPPDVEVVQVEQRDVPVYGEWIGTLDGMVNADVKAQVTGYLLSQAYKEGSFVKEGQVLFEIDPRPFQAALGQAEAQLAQAKAQLANGEAVQGRTQLDVDRYTPLVKEQAASQQDLDNAIQNNLAAKAAVATAKAQIQAAEAAVQTAKLNLEFTRLASPINGIAGVAQLQVGALVSPSSPPVTTVSTVDPIKVYFTVSEQEYLEWNRRFPTVASREAANRRVRLELILADGTTYPHEGTVSFADRQVNQSTGAIRIAGLFPNAGNILRPGGYGRVRAATRIKQGALLVPQRAVTELQGSYQVAVVDSENKVGIRTVKVGDRLGSLWIIDEGLNSGERVVAEGVQKVRPGTTVNPKPFEGGAGRKGA